MVLCVSLALPGIGSASESEASEQLASSGELGVDSVSPRAQPVRFDERRRRGERALNPNAPDGSTASPSVVLMERSASGGRGDKPTEDERLRACSLEVLMTLYVGGSDRAFDELYRRLTPKVYGYLLRLARKPERAEDLVQVTYSKLHRARGSYLEGAPLLPWVLAIARRAFFDESRALRSRREDLTTEGVLPEPSLPTPGETDVGLLERALSEIPEAYREAIVLTKITGLTVTEAAAVVESTPSAVKLRVHRGYKVLREAMERLAQDDAAV